MVCNLNIFFNILINYSRKFLIKMIEIFGPIGKDFQKRFVLPCAKKTDSYYNSRRYTKSIRSTQFVSYQNTDKINDNIYFRNGKTQYLTSSYCSCDNAIWMTETFTHQQIQQLCHCQPKIC